MKFAAFLSIFLLGLIFPKLTLAEVRIQQSNSGNSSTKINVTTSTDSNSETNVETNTNNNISIHQSGDGDNEVKIENNKFTVKGTLTAFTGDSISISNQKITRNSSTSISGELKVGNQAEASGVIQNSVLIAEKITVSGSSSNSNNSNTKININSNTNTNSETNASPSPSVSPSPSASTVVINSEKFEKTEINQLIKALENILSFLNRLFL